MSLSLIHIYIRNYPSGDEAECLRLLNEAVENGAQAVALCASGTEEIRRALERLSERGVPVATFNSDVPGGRRICYVGEDGHQMCIRDRDHGYPPPPLR